MSILSSLVRAYEASPDASPFGYADNGISVVVGLNLDGSIASVTDIRQVSGKKKIARRLQVPKEPKRASGIAPCFLWDKTSYVLGIAAPADASTPPEKQEKAIKRAAEAHDSFVSFHLEALSDSEDPGIQAFLDFLRAWTPDQFTAPLWAEDMAGQNVVFALETERLEGRFLHDRPAARAVWARINAEAEGEQGICLVTGNMAPIARLHASIKGIQGAQSAGASIVSFNEEAFASYGRHKGANAPVSEAATFAYTTILNKFLAPKSGHQLRIGGNTTVFWADCSDLALAREAEALALAFFDGADLKEDADLQTAKVAEKLQMIRRGASLDTIAPQLADGVRFHVLGLAPNVARIAIRYAFEGSFGDLAHNYQRYLQDMAILPESRFGQAPIWRMLQDIAVLQKSENIPPNLAGDWFRAILNGTPYPMTLMSATLMRIRADRNINPIRVAILKAVLVRNFKKEVPVAFDPTVTDKGYLLGRLFALYERIQSDALGKVGASIKDKYYGSASAAPQKVYGTLDKGAAQHLSKIAKKSPGRAVNLRKNLSEIMDLMSPGGDPFPKSLSAAGQALFALGYHHQTAEFFKPAAAKKADETPILENQQ